MGGKENYLAATHGPRKLQGFGSTTSKPGCEALPKAATSSNADEKRLKRSRGHSLSVKVVRDVQLRPGSRRMQRL